MKRLLLLFVWLLLTPCFAQASCGDWLAHPGDELVASSDDGGARAEDLSEMTEPMPIPRVPCDAPGCRQAPANPPIPSASPQVESKWINWSELGESRHGDVLLYELQDSDGRVLNGSSPTIERPPKS